MDRFVVILDAEGAKARDRVRKRLRNAFLFHEYSDTAFLVAGDIVTNDVAVAAGFKKGDKDGPTTGIVFRIRGYAGFGDRSLWEWLEKAESPQ